ncbi:uncharacterized protein RSE6_13504 [Rhynchosporium secalis]|uniref:Uncharacterized protein n=1 Tax=Rhynchosporium secalis TaxID=38038 RepID=A0A1E1MT15_RHYSE|nr:uncharacterized protein RSE6_13504 [Rhynchosporium secalis]
MSSQHLRPNHEELSSISPPVFGILTDVIEGSPIGRLRATSNITTAVRDMNRYLPEVFQPNHKELNIVSRPTLETLLESYQRVPYRKTRSSIQCRYRILRLCQGLDLGPQPKYKSSVQCRYRDLG